MPIVNAITHYILANAPNRVNLDIGGLQGLLGRWYQLGASEVVWLDGDGPCANVFYDQVRDDLETDRTYFRVRNSYLKGDQIKGKVGYGRIMNPERASEIQISFDTDIIPFPADLEMPNYLIVGLGPEWIPEEDDAGHSPGYEWAVITDPLRLYTWVMGRHQHAYKDNALAIDQAILDARLDGTYLGTLRFQDLENCPEENPFLPPVIPTDVDFKKYVGMKGEEVKTLLEDQFLWIQVVLVREGDAVIRDHRMDRILLYVDMDKTVIKEPHVG